MMGRRAWCWDRHHTDAPFQDVADGPCWEKSPQQRAEARHLDLSLHLSLPFCGMQTLGWLSIAPAVGCGHVCGWDGAVRRFSLTSAPGQPDVLSFTPPSRPRAPLCQHTAGLAPGCSLITYTFTLASSLHWLCA